MKQDFKDGFGAGFLVGVSMIIIAVTVTFMGDSVDNVDTKAMGELMCQSHGLQYSHRTWIVDSDRDRLTDNAGNVVRVPVIHCKQGTQTKETKLVDGVLVTP